MSTNGGETLNPSFAPWCRLFARLAAGCLAIVALISLAYAFVVRQATLVGVVGPAGSIAVVVDSSGWVVDGHRGVGTNSWQWGSSTYTVDPIIDTMEEEAGDSADVAAWAGPGVGVYIFDGPLRYSVLTIRHSVVWLTFISLFAWWSVRRLRRKRRHREQTLVASAPD